jgi:hypothetical protein
MSTYVPAPAGYKFASPEDAILSSTLPTSAEYHDSSNYANFRPATCGDRSSSDRAMPQRPVRLDIGSAQASGSDRLWLPPPAPTKTKNPWFGEAPQWVGLD